MLVIVTLILLAGLVWALNPSQPKLTPAPLLPPSPGCPKMGREFIPTNITAMPDPPTEALRQQVKNRVLFELNMQPCWCGCAQSVAACRINDAACETSRKQAKETISEEEKDTRFAEGKH